MVGVVTGFCPMWENFARPGSLEEHRGGTSLGLSSKTRAEFLAFVNKPQALGSASPVFRKSFE